MQIAIPTDDELTAMHKAKSLHAYVREVVTERNRLDAIVAKTSETSNLSSSQTKMKKGKPAAKRPPTGQTKQKKRGGQPGHAGTTLRKFSKPDHVIDHPLPLICSCGLPLGTGTVQSRQLVGIPPLRVVVTEHTVHSVDCPCGRHHKSEYPPELTAPVQYDASVAGTATWLSVEHMIPIARIAGLFGELFGQKMSTRTVSDMLGRTAKALTPAYASIKALVTGADVLHADETGMRVDGKNTWLHAAVTSTATFLAFGPGRGKEATDAIGILPGFKGRLVHDSLALYWKYADATHALCGAHLLRELRALHDTYSQVWAGKMHNLLQSASHLVSETPAQCLPVAHATELRNEYLELIAEGQDACPRALPVKGKKGKTKQTPAYNLLGRLSLQIDAVLRFVTEAAVPFTNNLAESVMRMPKVKDKTSGCHRTTEGANEFAVTRSCISTMKKQGMAVLDGLIQALRGNPPDFSPKSAT